MPLPLGAALGSFGTVRCSVWQFLELVFPITLFLEPTPTGAAFGWDGRSGKPPPSIATSLATLRSVVHGRPSIATSLATLRPVVHGRPGSSKRRVGSGISCFSNMEPGAAGMSGMSGMSGTRGMSGTGKFASIAMGDVLHQAVPGQAPVAGYEPKTYEPKTTAAVFFDSAAHRWRESSSGRWISDAQAMFLAEQDDRASEWERALDLWQRMGAQNVSADSVAYCSAITACATGVGNDGSRSCVQW